MEGGLYLHVCLFLFLCSPCCALYNIIIIFTSYMWEKWGTQTSPTSALWLFITLQESWPSAPKKPNKPEVRQGAKKSGESTLIFFFFPNSSQPFLWLCAGLFSPAPPRVAVWVQLCPHTELNTSQPFTAVESVPLSQVIAAACLCEQSRQHLSGW